MTISFSKGRHLGSKGPHWLYFATSPRNPLQMFMECHGHSGNLLEPLVNSVWCAFFRHQRPSEHPSQAAEAKTAFWPIARRRFRRKHSPGSVARYSCPNFWALAWSLENQHHRLCARARAGPLRDFPFFWKKGVQKARPSFARKNHLHQGYTYREIPFIFSILFWLEH